MGKLNVAVIGLGGVGGYFGGKLAHAFSSDADSSVRVFFVARGNHLEAIKEKGLILKAPEFGNAVCKPTLATERIGELPRIDVFLVAVKGYDLTAAAASMRDHITGESLVLPLLNGADIYERLRREIKAGIILPACVYISCYIEEAGIVVQVGKPGRIIFGKDPAHPHVTPGELFKLFQQSSIEYEWKEDAGPAIWEKYIFIAGFGLVSARYDRTLGEILDDPALKEKVVEIMNEIDAIASKRNIRLPEGVIDLSLKKAALFPRDSQTSLQRDINQKKGKSELELFGGTIIDLGKESGIPTPVTARIYRELGGA